MRRKYKIILILVCMMAVTLRGDSVKAVENKESNIVYRNEMQNSYNYLNDNIQNNKIDVDRRLDRITEDNKKLDERIREFDGKLDNKIKELEESLGILKYIGIIGIPSIILGFININRIIKKRVVQLVNKKVSELVDKRVDLLEESINRIDIENRFKENKRILLISTNESDDIKVCEQYISSIFKHIDIMKLDEFKELDNLKKYATYDVVVFNSDDGKKDDGKKDDGQITDYEEDIFAKYIKASISQTQVYFYINLKGGKFNGSITNRINFASSYSTIYSNLIDLFKYQEQISRKS